MTRVSIIVPTLNEAECLGRALRHLNLLEPAAWEVLVVDGGSEDETVALAEVHQIIQTARLCVLSSEERGRAVQMNRGAQAATGEILCFLHADTTVPDDLVAVIERTLADQTVACGGFISLMAGPQTTRWGVSAQLFQDLLCSPTVSASSFF